MPKNTYPYSAQITAKTIKDWQNVDFNLIIESTRINEAWKELSTKDFSIDYLLKYRTWGDDCLCCPCGLENDVSFDDKQKLGEKLINHYLSWKKANEEKCRKIAERKEKREHKKMIKKFLGQ